MFQGKSGSDSMLQGKCGNELMLQDKSDNELMLLAVEDDKAAFEVLVLRHYQEAISYCAGRLSDHEQAQDIVQDCFADIYAARRRYRTDFSFRTYLYAVLKHKLLDYLRKRHRTETTMLEDIPEPEDSSAKLPEESFLRKELREELAEWIQLLPLEQKRALLLYAVEGMSYREIALTMHKSVPQIKIAIHRARKKLQERRDTL